jgi:glutamyl-tRNA synthetase/glutamyl-Q tRNA(Asp) synthetase
MADLSKIPEGVVTRFAPSLTGYLHLGHVLHMIYVWGIARSRNGRVICRMEDHDAGRARPEYEEAILDIMEWLGFVPDDGVTAAGAGQPSEFRQSDCGGHYGEALRHLANKGLVYGCGCSRREILAKQSDGLGELCYPGTCSGKQLPLEDNTVRFRIPSHPVAFNDLALGECHQSPVGQCGDFSLRDRTGQWTYQFACVCDDIRQGINLVVRGEDILSSTARQIRLFEALQSETPQFFHHGLICGSDGEKLSKRQRSESISQLRDAGTPPEEVLGQAAHAGGLMPGYRPVSIDEVLLLIR